MSRKPQSIDHVKSLNKGLENKIISLQQKLEYFKERAKLIEPLQAQIAELRSKLEHLKKVEFESRTLKEDILDNFLKGRKLSEEERQIECKYRKEKEEMEAESEKLARELRSNNEHYRLLMEERDKQHEAEMKAMSEELETVRQSRQKLLSSQYDLQEKIDSLQSTDHSQEPKNKTQEYAQNENIRLAAENLALQERIDILSESCHRCRNQIRMLVIKLEEAGIEDVQE